MTTELLALDERNRFKFDANSNLYLRAYESLLSLNTVQIPESNSKLLEVIEGLSSAEIEGAVTTISSVLAGEDSNSNRMVLGAMNARRHLNTNGVSEQTIKSANSIVLGSCSRGEYRDRMVYVGSAATVAHVPASVEQVPRLMKDMLSYSCGNKILDSIICHFYFVYVHPFIDGNGRTARAMQLAGLTDKLLPLSKAILRTSSEYYTVLSSCEKSLDMSEFIQYMLLCIVEACDMYRLYEHELTEPESKLLSKMDCKGRGEISVDKAASIVGDKMAYTVLYELYAKGFLELSNNVFRLK